MEGFIIRICAHKYLWEGLIIVVNMMKSYCMTYSIYIMSYKNADGKYRAVGCGVLFPRTAAVCPLPSTIP